LQINNSRKIILSLLLSSAMLLSACDSDRHIHDLKKYVDDTQISAAKSQTISAAAQLHFPTPATYTANGARSPFEESSANLTISQSHPLQSYPLANLKFKGTVTQGKSILAFILAPDNKLYQVTIGDIIGDHYGKITNIYQNHIEIEEQVTDNASQTTSTRLVTLQLKE
jgi:Tfp pilus assembly protein PilP